MTVSAWFPGPPPGYFHSRTGKKPKNRYLIPAEGKLRQVVPETGAGHPGYPSRVRISINYFWILKSILNHAEIHH